MASDYPPTMPSDLRKAILDAIDDGSIESVIPNFTRFTVQDTKAGEELGDFFEYCRKHELGFWMALDGWAGGQVLFLGGGGTLVGASTDGEATMGGRENDEAAPSPRIHSRPLTVAPHGFHRAIVAAIEDRSMEGVIAYFAEYMARRTRAGEELAAFVDYCLKHPGLNFWKALKRWAGRGHVYLKKSNGKLIDSASFEKYGPVANSKDNE